MSLCLYVPVDKCQHLNNSAALSWQTSDNHSQVTTPNWWLCITRCKESKLHQGCPLLWCKVLYIYLIHQTQLFDETPSTTFWVKAAFH